MGNYLIMKNLKSFSLLLSFLIFANSCHAAFFIPNDAVTGIKLNSNVADNSTLEKVARKLQVKNGGITIEKMASVSTGTSVSSGNLAISPVLNFTTASTTPVDVTDSSITITTTGRPVLLLFAAGQDTGVSPEFYVRNNNAGSSTYVEFVRGSTMISTYRVSGTNTGEGASSMFLDTPAAGTYTYKLRMYAGANTAQIVNGKFWAFEL